MDEPWATFEALLREPFTVVHDHMGGTGFVFERQLSEVEIRAWKDATGVRPMVRADVEAALAARKDGAHG